MESAPGALDVKPYAHYQESPTNHNNNFKQQPLADITNSDLSTHNVKPEIETQA